MFVLLISVIAGFYQAVFFYFFLASCCTTGADLLTRQLNPSEGLLARAKILLVCMSWTTRRSKKRKKKKKISHNYSTAKTLDNA